MKVYNSVPLVLSLLIFLLLMFIRQTRIYIRTKAKGELFMASGILLFSIALILGNVIDEVVFFALGLFSYIVISIGLIILGSKESGVRNYIFKKTSFFQRLVGNVPKVDMKYKPTAKKSQGLSAGIITIAVSCIFLIFYNDFPVILLPMSFLLLGVLILIFSNKYGV